MYFLLSGVAHNKWGCAHTCFVHGFLICTFYVGLENYCFSTHKWKEMRKEKKKNEKKNLKKKKRKWCEPNNAYSLGQRQGPFHGPHAPQCQVESKAQ